MRRFARKIIGGLSLGTALFVFQACYGPPQDLNLDVLIEGKLTSNTTGAPVPGIKVSIAQWDQYQFSDAEGKFYMYTGLSDSYQILFQDVDAEANGAFFDCDTTITSVNEQVFLSIVLQEKP